MGLILLSEANREAPAQAELRTTCAGASCVNLHVILTPMGFTLGNSSHPISPEGATGYGARIGSEPLNRIACAVLAASGRNVYFGLPRANPG